MTLMIGTGPFGKEGGDFNFDTGVLKRHTLYMEDSPKRVRVVFGGETVADSRRARLLHETGLLPIYYFPEEDLRHDLLERTDHSTHCPFKGDASYRSVRVGDRVAENALWDYPEPDGFFEPLRGYAAFYFKKMDAWFEEDEEIFIHPKDPYHRVDVLDGSRHVRVEINGETVAETRRPKLLFETGLPTRYYIPPEDVRDNLLVPSEKETGCPYKGKASYRSVKAGGETVEDVVWFYPEPVPAAHKVKDHLCFFNEKVDLTVDGESQARPQTQWS